MKLADQVYAKYPNTVCFASKLIFTRTSLFTRWLHNRTPQELQDRLHSQGRQMVLLPMRVAVSQIASPWRRWRWDLFFSSAG